MLHKLAGRLSDGVKRSWSAKAAASSVASGGPPAGRPPWWGGGEL